jgi:SsrA-binding protein
MKVLAKNRRATFDYDLSQRLIAGLVLTGTETKSIKSGSVSLKGSFVVLRNNEAFLTGAHVTPYAPAAGQVQSDPTRTRKLLLHERELAQLVAHKQAGLSVVPTTLLLDRNLVKLEIGIGRGKKRYDKRADIKRRDTERDIARHLKR